MTSEAVSPTILRELALELRGRAAQLQGLGSSHVASCLAEAGRRLANRDSDEGRALRQALPDSCGLTPAMVDWALATTLQGITASTLQRLATSPYRPGRLERPPGLVAVVLAGNVFTAGFRAIALPLLLGAPVLAKAPSRDEVFPRALSAALKRIDPRLGACLEVVTFDRAQHEAQQTLYQHAEAVAVYGNDATIAHVRRMLPVQVRLIAHGHGLGAVHVPATELSDEARALRVAEQVAVDVAAYDQRGCLSPHVIAVEPGGVVDARGFAQLLSERGLPWIEERLPRGAMPADIAPAQMQWRGVAAARGALFEGTAHAVGYERDGELRVSPGYRNVGVYEVAGPEALGRWLQPLGPHLKVLGVAGPLHTRRLVAEALPAPLMPRLCEAGQMQTPPIHALMDGKPAWEGLLRWLELA